MSDWASRSVLKIENLGAIPSAMLRPVNFDVPHTFDIIKIIFNSSQTRSEFHICYLHNCCPQLQLPTYDQVIWEWELQINVLINTL